MTWTDQEKIAYRELSILFLDRDMFDAEADLIARNLSELDFTIPHLEYMLRYNIFPILCGNFLCLLGEWVGFSEPPLFRRIEARLTRPLWLSMTMWLPELLIWWALGWMAKSQWAPVRERLVNIHKPPSHFLNVPQLDLGRAGSETRKHGPANGGRAKRQAKGR
ncbi:hypothetical protein BD410DRAFT_531982 [Rickenella mellea]|uniref:DUF7079 domain-containing protein n=1 Tax=Rickenella mellea TaxID=50990 RepID=A0A4Y7QH15_9AGAM|nr:hypothetical protein BD410DRAFT_531982 [Rickenella mellea]